MFSEPPSPPNVSAWFAAKYGKPTAAQKAAWPPIARGENILLASPTGTGKTFAAFLGVIDQLVQMEGRGELGNTIHCLYVSPLRALSYDLEKNLREPLRELYGEKPPIRVELRTGDTKSSERARQFHKPPHILLTTPESLCVLLSQEKWLGPLGSVRWVIVDEIHALAENKRGAHLSLSLERMEHLCGKIQRIGLSATMSPLDEVGRFLVGTRGQCTVLDVSTAKKVKLSVHTPLRKNPYPEAGYTGQRMIRELGELIRTHTTTLVFCNVRSGAEATTYWLRENFPDLASQIECHHASLERDVRREVEDRLKRGELRAVVCSTSLELGIDIGSVDLVVMMSTPKGVSKALQRAGRAGHNIRSISRGILMATNISDLVESCATVLLSRQRQLDDVRLPDSPLDVLAQHLVSMGCVAHWKRSEALALVRKAYPYRNLDEELFSDVLDYLAGGGVALRKRYSEVFGKIELDDEGFRTRDGQVRRDFLQNIGVIPSVGEVIVRSKTRSLGSVEESFIRQLTIGDIFMIGGHPVRLDKVTQMEAWVTRADGSLPTVPRWNANKMPLSNRVAQEINVFRRELRAAFEEDRRDIATWITKRLDCGKANAEIVLKTHRAQHEISEIPTADFLLVEELDDEEQDALHYFFHSLIGRAANDALARVITHRISKARGGNAIATPHDYGFVLTMARRQRFREAELGALLRVEGFDEALDEGLRQSEMLKYHFRNAAQTGLMVYRNYFDRQKSVRKLQWSSEVIFNVLREHEPEHILLREARRDALRTFIDAEGGRAFLTAQAKKPVRLRKVPIVPPLSFAMYATKIKEALLVEDPYETMERLYHQWWSEIENEPHAT